MNRPHGVLVIPTGTLTRYAGFWEAFTGLTKAAGDAVIIVSGTNICEGRNRAIRAILADDRYQWALFLDDDHVFPRDALDVLLSVPEPNDIVSACSIQRVPPYGATAFNVVTSADNRPAMQRLEFHDLPTQGVIEVDAVGFGFVLVQRRVFEALEDPWFTFGRWSPNKMQEDIGFCWKAKEKGFRVFVHCGLRAGHITSVVVNRSQDGKGIELELGGHPRRTISFYEPSLMMEE